MVNCPHEKQSCPHRRRPVRPPRGRPHAHIPLVEVRRVQEAHRPLQRHSRHAGRALLQDGRSQRHGHLQGQPRHPHGPRGRPARAGAHQVRPPGHPRPQDPPRAPQGRHPLLVRHRRRQSRRRRTRRRHPPQEARDLDQRLRSGRRLGHGQAQRPRGRHRHLLLPQARS